MDRTDCTLRERKQQECGADPACHRVAYFEARIVDASGKTFARQARKLCAIHLGEVVRDLAEWARHNGITEGQVTVLMVDPPPAGQSLCVRCPDGRTSGDFLFAAIPLGG